MSANGRLTASELEYVEDNDQLNHAAAYWFRAARNAYWAEGGRGALIVEPAGAYRSWQVQYDMKHGIPSDDYWNLNPAMKVGLAAAGTSSHGTGNRFDAGPGFNAFLLRRGAEFGMVREFGSADPNHWKILYTLPAGGVTAPLPILQQRRNAMTARYLVAPGPIWAGIDLVAFRSVGGAIVTTVQATAEDISRMYPFPAEEVTRDELNKAVIAARLWVEQVVNASIGGAAAVDPKTLAAEIAPLLRLPDSDLTEDEFREALAAAATEIKSRVATIPVTVTVEQKPPAGI